MSEATLTILVAHAGAGATWQALVVLITLGLVAVVVGVVVGKVPLDEPGDLVLPLAATTVLASLSGATNSVLSDWVGWATPIGVVALVVLVVAATTRMVLEARSALLLGAAALAVVASLALHTTLEDAWHPIANGLQRDDVAIEVVAPPNGSDVPIGSTTVVVSIRGGSVGPGTNDVVTDDPEELGTVSLFIDGLLVADEAGDPRPPRESCVDGCAQVSWDVQLDRGSHVVSAEFLTATGESFLTSPAGAPTVTFISIEAG